MVFVVDDDKLARTLIKYFDFTLVMLGLIKCSLIWLYCDTLLGHGFIHILTMVFAFGVILATQKRY